jgi:hypothetical protein
MLRGYAVSPSDGWPSKRCAALDFSRGLRMDKPEPISPTDLYLELGTARAPVLIDVRTDANFDADDRLIVGARRLPENVDQWKLQFAKDHRIVVYGSQGDETSRGVAEALGAFGQEAVSKEASPLGLATGVRKWITRERPKIDRIACPWLIRRFIDPEAEFIYVPAEQVLAEAKAMGAIPYDIPDVEFTHEGERCSFDTFLRIYDIADPPLQRLALIVRGADTSRHDLAPQFSGLFAISLGLSANFPEDHAMLEHGMAIYDASIRGAAAFRRKATAGPPRVKSRSRDKPIEESATMRTRISVLAFILALAFIGKSHAGEIDWAKVDAALGKTASVHGEVHRYGLPRTDLQVTLDGVTIKPALALGGWLGFEPMQDGAVVMGDLVLTETEVNPVMS